MSVKTPAEEAVATFLEERREAVAGDGTQIGIDYVTVSGDPQDPARRLLELHFIPDTSGTGDDAKHAPLNALTADDVHFFKDEIPEDGLFELETLGRVDSVLTLTVRFAGDDDHDRRLSGEPIFILDLRNVAELDPFFSRVRFSVDLAPPLDDDCSVRCPPPPAEVPEAIDYLARDYPSFRRLLIEHLGHRLPAWKERSAADQLVALVELLADAADKLSYYQDAVATEAYLGTARRRISVRRHARLIGHAIAEGTNARTWVQFQTGGHGVPLLPGTGSITSAGTTVTGLGTVFLSELRVGQTILADGQLRTITAVAGENRLEVDQPFVGDLAVDTPFELFSTRAGTGTVAGLGTTITGTGTAFLAELAVGDPFVVAGRRPVTVSAVVSDLELVVNQSFDLLAGTAFARSTVQDGPGTVASAGVAVTGTGTGFTAELGVGDPILARDPALAVQRRRVVAVTSDTALDLDSPFGLFPGTTFERPATLDGTGTVAGSGTAIAGSGTLFLAEIGAGEALTAGGQKRRVTAVTSDLALTVDTPFGLPAGTTFEVPATQAAIGTLAGNGTAVTGTGTQFESEVPVGATLTAAGQLRKVVARSSDTDLVVDAPFDLAAGTTIDVPATQAGTGTVASTGTTVTGTGTNFSTELAAGDRITAAGRRRTVTAVTSDTELRVDAAFSPNLPAGTTFERPAAGQVAGAGTVAGSGRTVLGTGTAFLAELTAGETLTAGGQSRQVTAVTSDTVLVVDAPFDLVANTPFQVPDTQAGTGTVAGTGTAITGTGTVFESELQVDDRITAAGQCRIVLARPSDADLVVDAPFDLAANTPFRLAATPAGLVAGTGTVAVTGTAVTGTGTAFLTEVDVGAPLTAGGRQRNVVARSSDVDLIVDAAFDLAAGTVFQRPATQAGSGTVAVTGTAVTGTGTAFTTELVPGDRITAGGRRRTVTAVSSDTSLVVDAPFPVDLTGIPFEVPAAGQVAGTGTVAGSGSTVLGTGTNFLAELTAGETLTAGGQSRQVIAVTTDTALIVDAPFDLAAGTTFEVPATVAGVGTVAGNGTAVTGTGTSFLADLTVGDAIFAGGQRRRVTAVATDTALVVDAPFDLAPGTAFEIPAAAAAGTGTVESTGTAVSGTGTAFPGELAAGDAIFAGGQRRRVTAVVSDTLLEVDAAFDLPAGTAFEVPHVQDGSGTVESTGTAVTGTSTAFLTELLAGDRIIANNERRRVVTVHSATSLVIDAPFSADLPAGSAFQVPATQAGTGTVASTGTTVTGDSTVFESEFAVGDRITAAGRRRRVVAVNSEVELRVDAPIAYDLPATTAYQVPGRQAGTGTVASAGTAVTGSSTDFLAEVAVGDPIVADGERRVVTAVISDTALTVDTAFSSDLAGVAFEVLTRLAATGTVASAGSEISGTGTAFLTDLAAGDRIYAGDQGRQVEIVRSDALLEVDAPFGLAAGTAFEVPDRQAGTGTVESAGTTVTGTGTFFLTELGVGDPIVAAGVRRTVTSLVSDTELEIAAAFPSDLPPATAFEVPARQAGTGTVESAGTTVTGTGTSFTTELWVGASIVVGGQRRTVTAITSDTVLEVDLPFGLVGGLAFEIPGLEAGTGTAESAGTTVTGTGTYFLIELAVGDPIIAAGARRTVTALVSNTELEIDAAFPSDLPPATAFEVPARRAGGGTIQSAGTTVTGTGTAFLTAFTVGDPIYAAGVRRTVTALVSDTELEIDAAFPFDLQATTAFEVRGRQTGTGTVAGAGTTVNGTGTRFTIELGIGDRLVAGGHSRIVTAVTSDASLQVDLALALAGNAFARPGAPLLTPIPGQTNAVLGSATTAVRQALTRDPVVFETMHPAELYSAHNEIPIYTWGSPVFSLPAGAITATLDRQLPDLRAGDVLIFEEVKGAETGLDEDADPTRRHPVRLTAVTAAQDPLGGPRDVTEVTWDEADALPFPFRVNAVDAGGTAITGIAVARGNVVLADHGRSVGGPEEAVTAIAGRFRPRLERPRLTHCESYDHPAGLTRPAADAWRRDPNAAQPVVELRADEVLWNLRRDLLSSDRFAPDYVAEIDNHERAVLRFGDGTLGLPPAPEAELVPRYRVGLGVAGNLGAESLAHLISDDAPPITAVRNPLPARGGIEPETVADVRRQAPGALLELAPNTREQDFADVALNHPEVERAAAALHWTGSWHRLVVAVQRQGGAPVDDAFREEIHDLLADYRLAGWELEVTPLRFIGLDILLTVRVAPDAVPAAVEKELLRVFSNRELPGGGKGFFHPDHFDFGHSVYLSQIVDAAMAVDGVVAVDTGGDPPALNRFRRYGEPSRGELAGGQIRMTGHDIARVDNDPNAPENGRIRFFMEGGR
ncbi:MAG: hypothetical protein GY841_22525 [FCB group bacterium]|nr:hypothetical protein [FCB group bacterium]